MRTPFHTVKDQHTKIIDQKIKDNESIRPEDWTLEQQEVEKQYRVHMNDLESILNVHQMDTFIDYLYQYHPTLTDKQLVNLWSYFNWIDQANDGGIDDYIYEVPVGNANSAWDVDLNNIPEMTIMVYARILAGMTTEQLLEAVSDDESFDIDKGIIGDSKEMTSASWSWAINAFLRSKQPVAA